MVKRGRYIPSPVQRIMSSRNLFLPNLLIGELADLDKLFKYLDDLPKQVHKLKFNEDSFVKDFIAKQYLILKYDLYIDTLEHINGRMIDQGPGKNKERDYWQELQFIGYQFRSVGVILLPRKFSVLLQNIWSYTGVQTS